MLVALLLTWLLLRKWTGGLGRHIHATQEAMAMLERKLDASGYKLDALGNNVEDRFNRTGKVMTRADVLSGYSSGIHEGLKAIEANQLYKSREFIAVRIWMRRQIRNQRARSEEAAV